MIKSNYTNTTNKHHHHHLSEELSLKCREYIQTLILRGVDFRREFDIYDTTYEGCVLQTDFRHLLLDKLALNKYTNNSNTTSNSRHESKEGGHNSDPSFTLPELERIENIYRDNKDPRKINYIRFIHNIHPRHYNYTQAYNNNNSITYNNTNIHSSIWYNAELLRMKIRRRCDYLAPGELRRPYRHFNRSKTYDNSINKTDFGIAIRDLGLKLSFDQELQLFKYFTTTPTTTLTTTTYNNTTTTGQGGTYNANNSDNSELFYYSDFVVFVKDPLFDDVVWKFRRNMARARVSINELEMAIRGVRGGGGGAVRGGGGGQNYDLSRTTGGRVEEDDDDESEATITYKQFYKVLDRCNIDMSKTDALRLLTKFDKEETQQLHIQSFLSFVTGSSTSYNINTNNSTLNLGSTGNKSQYPRSQVASGTASINLLKSKIESKLDEGYSIHEVYSYFSDDNSGLVSVTSLLIGAREVGMNLSQAECRYIIRLLVQACGDGGPLDEEAFFAVLDINTDTTTTTIGTRGGSGNTDKYTLNKPGGGGRLSSRIGHNSDQEYQGYDSGEDFDNLQRRIQRNKGQNYDSGDDGGGTTSPGGLGGAARSFEEIVKGIRYDVRRLIYICILFTALPPSLFIFHY